jgi:hypothetical protein
LEFASLAFYVRIAHVLSAASVWCGLLSGANDTREVPTPYRGPDWWSAPASPLFAMSLTASIWLDWCKSFGAYPGRVFSGGRMGSWHDNAIGGVSGKEMDNVRTIQKVQADEYADFEVDIRRGLSIFALFW